MMVSILKKENILKAVFAVWLVLWVFFLLREGKDGQYRSLGYLYTHGYDEKMRHVIGDELYDFLVFCGENMPEGATYELSGFERFSVSEVRARYFLWPLKSVGEGGDFKIVYGGGEMTSPGYALYKRYGSAGRLFKRRDGV